MQHVRFTRRMTWWTRTKSTFSTISSLKDLRYLFKKLWRKRSHRHVCVHNVMKFLSAKLSTDFESDKRSAKTLWEMYRHFSCNRYRCCVLFTRRNAYYWIDVVWSDCLSSAGRNFDLSLIVFCLEVTLTIRLDIMTLTIRLMLWIVLIITKELVRDWL